MRMGIAIAILAAVIGFGAIFMIKGRPPEEVLIEEIAEEIIKYETGLDVDLYAVTDEKSGT